MIDRGRVLRGLAALPLLGTAAALLLATTAVAQQGPPPAASLGAGMDAGPEGIKVLEVFPGSTGAAIGMQEGDIVLEAGGKTVTGPPVIIEYLAGLRVGDPLSLKVGRAGRTVELTGRAMAAPKGLSPIPVQADELFETWNGRVSRANPMEGLEVNGWSLAASMPLARSEHAIAEMDGKVWVLGGYPPGRLPSNLVQVYDPARDRWSLGPQLPQPIHHTHVAAVGGKLYVIGGEINGASTARPATYVANVWMHDPAVGGWVARSPMPTPRSGGGKAVIDGKIYVAGGRPPGGHAFQVYDPATDKWEKLPDLPTQRNHLAMVALNGKVIVAGGRVDDLGSERVTAVEIYDPKTRRWTKGAPLPAPRGGITGAAHAGCMFVFAGEGEETHVLGLTPTTYGYDPRADRWTRLPDLPIAMHGLKGSAVIGGRIFLPGGAVTAGGNTGTNAMQVYRPTMRCE